MDQCNALTNSDLGLFVVAFYIASSEVLSLLDEFARSRSEDFHLYNSMHKRSNLLLGASLVTPAILVSTRENGVLY